MVESSIDIGAEKKVGEKPSMALFYFNFFQGMGTAFLYSIALALFISELSIGQFPAILILGSVILLLSGRIFAYLEYYFSLKILLKTLYAPLLSLLLALTVLWLFQPADWYVFLLIVSMLWVFSLSLFASRSLTEYYKEKIGEKYSVTWYFAGELPGRFIGFILIPLVVSLVGEGVLLFLALLSFMGSFYFVIKLINTDVFLKESKKGSFGRLSLRDEGLDLRKFFGNKFIRSLITLSAFVTLSLALLHFAFLENLSYFFEDRTEVLMFIGMFMSLTSAVVLLFRFLLITTSVREMGIRTKLLVLPIVLLVLSGVLLILNYMGDFAKSFWVVCTLILVFMALFNSMHRPIFQALLTPLVQNLRFRGDTIMNGLVSPFVLGLSGLFLLFVYQKSNSLLFDPVIYAAIFSIFCWVVVIFSSGKNYVQILQNAVGVRFFKGAEEAIKDKGVLDVLDRKLESDHSEEVIYSLELLYRFDEENVLERLRKLLKHPSSEVKIHTILKIKSLDIKELSADVMFLMEEDSKAEVKEASIKAVASLDKGYVSEIVPMIEAEDHFLRKGAVTALMQHGEGNARLLAEERLQEMTKSEEVSEKKMAIQIIAELEDTSFFDTIMGFMHDEDEVVVKAAIEATGKIQDEKYLPLLIDLIKCGHFTNEAKRALEMYGELALPIIDEEFGQANYQQDRFLVHLCQVCGNIGGEKAHEMLWWLVKYPWVELQTEALLSLKTSGYIANDKLNLYKVTDKIDRQCKQVFWLYNAVTLLQGNKNFSLLHRALEFELKTEKVKTDYLIGFLYGDEEEKLRVLRANLGSLEKEDKQEAYEILEEKLSSGNADKLLIIFGEYVRAKKIEKLSRFYSSHLLDEITVVLTVLHEQKKDNNFNRWTRATALFSMSKSFYPSLLKSFKPYLLSDDLLLQQAAIRTLREFCEDRFFDMKELLSDVLDSDRIKVIMKNIKDQTQTLLEIEKVIILKSTSLFSETPEIVLTDVAKIVKEERVQKGEVIFKKGDIGNCMYVIYEGEVKIHIGTYRLNTLINRDFFGDLGLLDTNPRSATATAERDTLLLRLDQDAFYDLMAQRPEVAKGIVQVLCGRIRVQDSLIMDLQKKLDIGV
ncbi:cyclic nucleotide-binding domain-containing protein [Flammeovirgaceae bacterium SG7u.111]|nr:cyclic nucleotide-binding domain-containing protein [Flammeovirgaceae bacterium SG7u.132]WPO33107.1 cyclic nucleotide-binding domain-containing protein [Flammeovirgaceae bacterium SG7u.111]